MKDNISISFIVPVYNVEKYISRCLESILSQIEVFPDSEILVINDGTPDQAMDIVLEYAKRYRCIRTYNQENLGLSAARNIGIELAVCSYIWFIDSDDWLEYNALKVLSETIVKYPNADVYITALNWTYQKEIRQDINNISIGYLTGKKYLDSSYPFGSAQRFIQKRTFVRDNELLFIPGVVHEDGPYGIMLMYLAQKVVIIESPIYGYRLNNYSSIMHTISIKSAYDLIIGHKKLMIFKHDHVNEHDKLWFDILSWSIFIYALRLISHLFYSQEYNDFIKTHWTYIKQQTLSIIYRITYKDKMKYVFFIIAPRLTIYFLKLLKRIRKIRMMRIKHITHQQ